MIIRQGKTKNRSFLHGPVSASPSGESWETPLVRTVPASGLSPVDLFGKGSWKGSTCLLDGSAGGWFDGRYALFGCLPFAVFKSKGDSNCFITLDSGRRQSISSTGDPLANLQDWLNRFQPSVGSDRPFSDIPFLHGGVVGFFSYDLVRQFEAVPSPSQDDTNLPDIYLLFLNLFVVVDHPRDCLYIIFNPTPEIRLGKSREKAYREGEEKIDAIYKTLTDPKPYDAPDFRFPPPPAQADRSPAAYMEMVRRAKGYIAAGDIFQANLSHRLTFRFPFKSLFPIYRRLWRINPSPFSAYLDLGEIQIASGSPERLVCIKKGAHADIVETRPIAGTRPRGRDPLEDIRMIKALYESEKERAEHLMLIDLERNDLGKICRYGTVRVDSLMTLEKYSHVFHLVSNVRGELIPGASPLQVLQALFPGGTITGVPKIRCMEIIAELEGKARGIYTGAIGYIGFGGEMDLNIAIRTWVRRGDEMMFQVGAGIVADSDPQSEYQETLQKAAALMKALQHPSL